MPRRLVAGNWKMNGSLDANAALLQALASQVSAGAAAPCRVVVCVPTPYLQQTKALLDGSPVAWGAQDVSAHAKGAYTGEVSAAMLREFGCTYAIVGHSERRQYHGESDDLVARKAVSALAGGLTPIVCVGETLDEREAERTEEIVGRQLDAVLERLQGEVVRTVIAYEPIWAIGTGRTATPDQAQAVHRMLRERLRSVVTVGDAARAIPLLYGGSVKADNADELFARADIDGGLVGGGSLNAAEFLAICGEASVARC
jgi:triosephosphate isomerase